MYGRGEVPPDLNPPILLFGPNLNTTNISGSMVGKLTLV